MTAVQLVNLLKSRHSDGVFVPECKMGSAGSRSLDGWALLPTWSPLTSIGYEVKVTRSDWLRDQKFEDYRACCHLFIVVAPKGIVHDGELPAGVGLLEPIGQGTGQRLVMRVKPVRQEPDAAKMNRLMAHALMWKRAQGDVRFMERERRMAHWREVIEQQRECYQLARQVRGHLRKALDDAAQRVAAAEHKATSLQAAAEVLAELGIKPGYDRWATRRNVQAALGDEQTQNAVRDALSALNRVQAHIDQAVEAKAALGRTA